MNRILAGFTFLSLLLILFSVNRGFDFTDEGLYALLAVPSQENIAGIINYDLFFKLFYKLTGIEFGLVGLRILRLLSCFVAAAALTSFWKNFTMEKEIRVSVFLLSLVGILGSYGFLPQSLSYNSINLMCACLWLALIAPMAFFTRRLLLIGLTLAILFYTKITVCFILGVLTVGLTFWNGENTAWVSKLLLLSLPFVILELLFFISLGDTGILRALDAREMLDYRPDYHMGTIFKYSLVGVFWSFGAISPFYLGGYLKRMGSRLYVHALGVGILLAGAVGYFTTITNELNHLLLLSTLAVVGFHLGNTSLATLPRRKVGLLFLLLLFPFILHFGSNVYFLRLGIQYWVFWLLPISFLIPKEKTFQRLLFHSYVSIFSLVLVANGLSLYAFNNYSFSQKTVLWEYRDNKFINLPKVQVDIYQSLKKELAPAKDLKLLSIYRNPGLLYIIGRNHPKTPGLWTSDQLEYFFSPEDSITVLLYNDKFDFPFDQNKWEKTKSFSTPGFHNLHVLWKK